MGWSKKIREVTHQPRGMKRTGNDFRVLLRGTCLCQVFFIIVRLLKRKGFTDYLVRQNSREDGFLQSSVVKAKRVGVLYTLHTSTPLRLLSQLNLSAMS